MNHLRRNLVGLFACLLAASAVHAQPYDGRYREFGHETLARVRADLNRAEADLRYLSGEEMRRFNFVRSTINEFDRKWEHGRYAGEDLNEAIGGLARMVERSRLRPRDRDFLADDLRRLREMRERYERYHR
ncbi:MAG: hypothetical protein JO022_00225 [Acidobacteriaceae bacterium]|nr:hypothetical protein [Acidobacteriaceae bacterium]